MYDAGNEVSRLRSRDQATADRLQTQLDDLRDEVVYLKVKLRKEGSVNRADYNDVRRHVDAVRSEARGITMGTTDDVKEGRATFPAATSGTVGTGSGSGTGTSGSGGVLRRHDRRPEPERVRTRRPGATKCPPARRSTCAWSAS